MAAPMATIRDVAREAGVSTATVSRVLSRPELVNAETRASVMAAVETLGYTPNAAAKSLRTLRSGKVLVTVPGHRQPVLLPDPAGHRERRAARRLLGAARRHAARRQARAAVRADAAAARGRRSHLPGSPAAEGGRRAGALAAAGPGAGRQRLRVQSRPGRAERAHRQRQGAFEAVDHLCQLGHRHIGVVTGPMASPLSRDRLKGAMARANRDQDPRHRRRSRAETSRSNRASPPAISCCRRASRRPASSASTTRWRSACCTPRGSAACGSRTICRWSGFDDIRFAQYCRSAA